VTYSSAIELGNSSAVGRGQVGCPTQPRPTILLSPCSDGKPEAATAFVVAPDDEHEDARKHVELYLNEK
jgi:hypothetical protein